MTSTTVAAPAGNGRAGSDPPTADVELYRARVRECIRADVVPRVADAERDRRFPRAALRALGAAGILRDRWEGGPHGDWSKSIVLSEEMAVAGCGGVGVGISLHLEAVTSILHRYAKSPLLQRFHEGALDGTLVGCLATTERDSGSDLTGVQVTAEPHPDGWHVRGQKAFVSPGPAADFALVLCRHSDATPGGATAPLMLVLVPRDCLRVEQTLRTLGMRGLETARMSIDGVVPNDAVVGRPGTGLLVVSWGLVHERLAIAAELSAVAGLALDLAIARARRRKQFGSSLFEHQALRMRLAEMWAEVALLKRAVRTTAVELDRGADAVRETAACKVVAARIAERVVSESMHVFGGAGYLEDETPLPQMLRDVKIGRLGAGSDEVMLELVAAALPDPEPVYDAFVGEPR